MPDKITKFIESLEGKMRKKVKAALIALKKNPYSMKNVKKLESYENTYRLRIGKIRLVYRIIQNMVEVIDIDYRGNIY